MWVIRMPYFKYTYAPQGIRRNGVQDGTAHGSPSSTEDVI